MNADGTFPERLPCPLTDDEVRQRGELLAMTLAEIAEIEEEFALERQRIRGEIKRRRERARGLTGEVSTRTEIREVACVRRILPDDERVEIVRVDTGEVVRTRPLTPEERQEALFPSIGPPLAGPNARLPVNREHERGRD
ncbi:MAG: hypothetical protein DCC71_15430 [Proteobacteria bacterium]|nr:MAG: hypothetical protein DCC71_15430 [Pseudomonadota bacterium]